MTFGLSRVRIQIILRGMSCRLAVTIVEYMVGESGVCMTVTTLCLVRKGALTPILCSTLKSACLYQLRASIPLHWYVA